MRRLKNWPVCPAFSIVAYPLSFGSIIQTAKSSFAASESCMPLAVYNPASFFTFPSLYTINSPVAAFLNVYPPPRFETTHQASVGTSAPSVS